MAEPCLSLDLLEKLVREGTLVGPAGSPDGAVAEEHLRDCSHCRTRLAEMREVDAFIAGVSQRKPGGPRDSRDSRGARDSRPDDPRSPSLRDDFPGYAVEAIVDIGGQGAIYRARQLATGRMVAIKVPLGDAVRRLAKRYRFRREIELTSRLDHPGIVSVFGVCEAPDGRIGCVMEFVEGLRFDEWAAVRRGEGRDGVRRIVAATAKVAEAIAYAHQRGVLHRDLKPSNVLVTVAGLPRVLDFGLAKALDSGSGSFVTSSFVTATGAFLGTLAYAAPEQVDGRSDETDIRTDVYGIGLVLYQALAGRVPWDAEAAPPELCTQIRRGDAPRPTPLGGAPDTELDAIVLKAIATDMDRRYASATLLAEDLDRWLTGRPVRARFDSRWYVVRKTAWRRRWWIAAAMVLFCLLGTLTTIGLKARSASMQAALADAVHNAREMESHWSSIADARATARDDFTFGEERVWDVFLNATGAVELGGIEGTAALGHAFSAGSDGSSQDMSVGSDWSVQVPTSPAYWALAEIYLRTPVVASLPELRKQQAAIDSTNDQVLVGSGRVIERWDWRTGQMVGRIDLPLPEGANVSGVLTSKGWACVLSTNNIVALIDLERRCVFSLPTKSDFAALSGPNLACCDVTADRRRVALWRVDGESPRRLWSRDLEFQVAYVAIDDGGHFLASLSQAGDLVALDLTSGVELLRRGREEVPQYRWIGSRGRPGEILAWGDGLLAALEWTESGVSLSASQGQTVVDGEGVHSFVPGSLGGRFLAKLDRRGVAIGHVDQPVGKWQTIPALRGAGALPGLFADDRHLLVCLAEGERHAIVDLDSTGITQLANPTVFKIGETPTIFAVGFVEGGGALLTASMDGSLRRFSVSSNPEAVNDNERADAPPSWPEIAATSATSEGMDAPASSHGLTCFAVDGAWTYVGTHDLGDGNAKLFRVRDGESELLLDDGRSWYCGIVLAPGSALWALGGDGRIFRMNLRTGAIEAERPLAPNRAFRAIARMAHRGLVIAGSRHPVLHLLDETTLEPVCAGVPMAPMCDIAVSPTDPDLFVTVHDTGVIRVWRVTGGSVPNEPPQVYLVREMGAHACPIFCAAFHPSGRILATGGGAAETRDIRLWDLELGRELAAFSLFDLGVFAVAFSPDGRWLAAGGEPVPGRFAEGGQAFLIDLTAGERAIAGNLEYHIARLKRANGGELPPQAEMLRRRFGGDGAGFVGGGGGAVTRISR